MLFGIVLLHRKKQLLLEDKAKQQRGQSSDAFKALSIDKVEPVERAVLAYSPLSDINQAGQKAQVGQFAVSAVLRYLEAVIFIA